MSENKNYYYMKLKDNFYNTDDIKLLEAMPNGYEYSSFYLKLCLMSLKEEGRLVFKGRIPYKPEMLSTITGHNIDIIRVAIKILQDMEMISILDTGTIFINDIQALVGSSNSEADRKRKYRQKIKKEELTLLPENTPGKDQMGHSSGHRPPEKELEKELEIKDKDIENNISPSEEVIPKKPRRKKKPPSELQKYILDRKTNFIKQVSEIYPKNKTCKEGFRRLEKFYDEKILFKGLPTITKNNEIYFTNNLKACLELCEDKQYMYILKNYVGTQSEKSKNYHEENFIEKLEYQNKTKPKSKTDATQHYAHSGNAAEERKQARETAEKLWRDHGIATEGFIFDM